MPEWEWLASTKALQERSYGFNFDALKDEALADYIVWNHTALVVELGEFMNEIGWKPWTHPRGWVHRELAVRELVDVAHFLANILVALGVTDAEWKERYAAKQAINAKRQADGYDGVKDKCAECKRELVNGVCPVGHGQAMILICGDCDFRTDSLTEWASHQNEHAYTESASIVLPCHHVGARPPDHGGTVTCHCGAKWKMIPDHGGQSWQAVRLQ